jgi:hypothetical protein
MLHLPAEVPKQCWNTAAGLDPSCERLRSISKVTELSSSHITAKETITVELVITARSGGLEPLAHLRRASGAHQ